MVRHTPTRSKERSLSWKISVSEHSMQYIQQDWLRVISFHIFFFRTNNNLSGLLTSYFSYHQQHSGALHCSAIWLLLLWYCQLLEFLDRFSLSHMGRKSSEKLETTEERDDLLFIRFLMAEKAAFHLNSVDKLPSRCFLSLHPPKISSTTHSVQSTTNPGSELV